MTKAVEQTGIKDVCIAGGVSANSGLRKGFHELAEKKGWRTFIPKLEYCTDNAAMIAMAGYYKYLAGEFAPLDMLVYSVNRPTSTGEAPSVVPPAVQQSGCPPELPAPARLRSSTCCEAW